MNPQLFEEIRLIGSKKIVTQTEAKQFPEMVFIHDLVVNYAEMADAITENEYLRLKD